MGDYIKNTQAESSFVWELRRTSRDEDKEGVEKMRSSGAGGPRRIRILSGAEPDNGGDRRLQGAWKKGMLKAEKERP